MSAATASAKKVRTETLPVAGEENSESKKVAPPKKAVRAAGLPHDPNRGGNLWCGICQVSLTPKQSEGHLGTKRHQENSAKHLTAAMKIMKADQ